MPYIAQNLRYQWNDLIDVLVEKIENNPERLIYVIK